LVASIGSYIYSTSGETLYVHLYNNNQGNFQVNGINIQIGQETQYPWDGNITLTLQLEQPTEFELALRIPGWCRDYQISINGASLSAKQENGYVRIQRDWTNGDMVSLALSMPVERMTPHPEIRQNAGQIALQRGPIVYCLEEVDNGARLANVAIPRDSKLLAENSDLFGGISVIKGEALRIEPKNWSNDMYRPQSTVEQAQTPFTFTAIPYFLWANRQPGEMRVWIREV
jgi:DUF1680 family protein